MVSLVCETLSPQDLNRVLVQALAQDPLTQLVILPSGAASTQALITVMDLATTAGMQNMRVLRLEARQ